MRAMASSGGEVQHNGCRKVAFLFLSEGVVSKTKGCRNGEQHPPGFRESLCEDQLGEVTISRAIRERGSAMRTDRGWLGFCREEKTGSK